MKYAMILSLMALGLVVSCGEEQTSKDFKRGSLQSMQVLLSDQWCNQYDGVETMTISNNNSFQTDRCGVVGSYELKPDNAFTMTVTSSNEGQDCTPVGVHECSYEFKNNDQVLDLRCQISSTVYETTFHRGSCN